MVQKNEFPTIKPLRCLQVAEWVTFNQTEAYYTNGQSGLTSLTHDAIRDALNKVDAVIDFSEFDVHNNWVIDCITFLHSGYGAEGGGTDAFGTYYTDIDTAPVDATRYLDRSASPNTTYVYQVEVYIASFTAASNTVTVVF